MKIKITSKIIAALKPCSNRWDNFVSHYPDFKGDIIEFLDLKNITVQDKIWVVKQLAPVELAVVFSIDCAFSAADAASYAADAAAYAAYAYAAYAADADDASYAADAAAYAAVYAAKDTERSRQIESLKYLIQGWRE